MASVGGSFEVETIDLRFGERAMTLSRAEVFDLWRVLCGVLATRWLVTRDEYPAMWEGLGAVFVTTHSRKPGQPMAWCDTPSGVTVELYP